MDWTNGKLWRVKGLIDRNHLFTNMVEKYI